MKSVTLNKEIDLINYMCYKKIINIIYKKKGLWSIRGYLKKIIFKQIYDQQYGFNLASDLGWVLYHWLPLQFIERHMMQVWSAEMMLSKRNVDKLNQPMPTGIA